MPPRYYPPAAPYAALTEYLRDLIHDKILTRFIAKALLYPEFLRDIDTTEVKLRRRHKTFVRMYRNGSTSSTSEESETSSERLERQDAVEYTSNEGSRVYSGVKYKTGKTDSWDRTVYESFIDHGEGAGEVCYQRLHDSVSSFCFVTECDSPSRESFMIGSTPMRYVDNKRQDSDDNVIHLTTAKMTLLDIKQKSEQSQTSSFEHKLSGGGWKNMACEDLPNIDDSLKVGNKHKSIQEEKHHSMPTQFVGNRFNQSSLTEIYIPSCKSQNENVKNHLATPCNSFEDDQQQSKSSHSSSVLIQDRKEMTIAAPDQLTAEILYNLEQFEENASSHCQSFVRDLSPYVKEESIESDKDKRMSIDKGKTSNQPHPERPTEHEPVYANKRHDPKFVPPATIYSSDSDSGMAGSYTLSPSDQICHRSFIGHIFNPHVTPSSIDYFAPHPQTISDPRETLNQSSATSTHRLQPTESLEGENRAKVLINFESGLKSSSMGDNVYYSGMYAHWWKKEKLPLEMIESIVKLSDVESDKRDRGSGKKPLKIHLMMLHLRVFLCNYIFFFSLSLALTMIESGIMLPSPFSHCFQVRSH